MRSDSSAHQLLCQPSKKRTKWRRFEDCKIQCCTTDRRWRDNAAWSLKPSVTTFCIIILYFIPFASSLSSIRSFTSNLKSTMGAGISTTQWYLHGKRHFTKTGYLRHIKSYTSPVQDRASIGIGEAGADGVDMTNKCVVITGEYGVVTCIIFIHV